MATVAGLGRLRRRAEFLAVAAKGRRAAMPGLVIQALPHGEPAAGSSRDADPPPDRPGNSRLGFTASRKVGNAVARNRARRRLRALAAELVPEVAPAGFDLVIIARRAAVERPAPDLRADFLRALTRAIKQSGGQSGGRPNSGDHGGRSPRDVPRRSPRDRRPASHPAHSGGEPSGASP